jgi:hypothetical protein
MTETKAQAPGVVIAFPRQSLGKRRRIQPPPMKRIRLGPELRVFIERMANGGRA